jgi:hypothetical protein
MQRYGSTWTVPEPHRGTPPRRSGGPPDGTCIGTENRRDHYPAARLFEDDLLRGPTDVSLIGEPARPAVAGRSLLPLQCFGSGYRELRQPSPGRHSGCGVTADGVPPERSQRRCGVRSTSRDNGRTRSMECAAPRSASPSARRRYPACDRCLPEPADRERFRRRRAVCTRRTSLRRGRSRRRGPTCGGHINGG